VQCGDRSTVVGMLVAVHAVVGCLGWGWCYRGVV